jgi:hypothetical protein
MAEYDPLFGVVIEIDNIIVPKTSDKYYYFLTLCICPPAEYYKDISNDL